MKVVFYDGSTAECNEIEIGADGFILDGYRLVPFYCVLRILANGGRNDD